MREYEVRDKGDIISFLDIKEAREYFEKKVREYASTHYMYRINNGFTIGETGRKIIYLFDLNS